MEITTDIVNERGKKFSLTMKQDDLTFERVYSNTDNRQSNNEKKSLIRAY